MTRTFGGQRGGGEGEGALLCGGAAAPPLLPTHPISFGCIFSRRVIALGRGCSGPAGAGVRPLRPPPAMKEKYGFLCSEINKHKSHISPVVFLSFFIFTFHRFTLFFTRGGRRAPPAAGPTGPGFSLRPPPRLPLPSILLISDLLTVPSRPCARPRAPGALPAPRRSCKGHRRSQPQPHLARITKWGTQSSSASPSAAPSPSRHPAAAATAPQNASTGSSPSENSATYAWYELKLRR